MPDKSQRTRRGPSLALIVAGFLLLASILPLVMLGLISDYVSRSVIGRDVTDYNRALVSAQRDYLDIQFQEIESLIINISGVDEIKTAIDDEAASPDGYTRLATHAKIGYILSGYSGVKGLVSLDIFTPGGAHYHVGDTLNVEKIDQTLLETIKEDTQRSDSLVTWLGVEDNVNSNSTHKKVMTAARVLRVFDAASLQEKPGALLLVNFGTESLHDHFSRLEIGPGAYFIVIDGNGRLVYHPDRATIGSEVSPAFMDKMADGGKVMEVDGQEMLVTHTTSNINDWMVISLVPYKNVTSSADIIRGATLLVVASSFAFIALMVWIVSRTVVRPLTKITESFQQIQNGTFDWRIRLKETRTDEIGELTRWFNIFLNSMEAKNQAEQELLKAKDAAEAANRAKSVFLANMSHELRTPLNAILGFSELLSKDAALAPAQRENVETINRSGEHLLGLINDILDLSKIESGRADLRPHTFDLQRMIQGLGEMFEIRARQKNLKLVVESAADVPQYINADEGKLRQVLINLLGNAIKFTRTGTVVLQVSLAASQSGREPAQSCLLHFSVEDTGIGIAPEELEYIFEPFTQSKAGAQLQDGTGLGLTISRQQVELLGGRLTIESKAGAGSTFSFVIPVTIGAVTQVAASLDRVVGLAPGETAEDGAPFRILIAEDAEPNRRFLVEVLRPCGFEVREALNGEEAVAVWEAWRPHLIFMDLRMPGLNGLEATRRIKATPLGRQTSIIMLTASAFEEDRNAALQQGCDDFIHKPVRESQIFEVLQQQLGVQFVYAPVAPTTSRLERVVPGGQIPPLSDAWKEGMRQAVREADVVRMQDLIRDIEADYPAFSAGLTEMVYHFDYAGIRALIDAGADFPAARL